MFQKILVPVWMGMAGRFLRASLMGSVETVDTDHLPHGLGHHRHGNHEQSM